MTDERPVATEFSAPTAPVATPPEPRNPYGVLGVVGFALSFFFVLNIAGLVISIVALVKSKRHGFGNGFALAGIIIAGIGIAVFIVVAALVAPTLIDAAQTCARLGDGVHQIGSATYSCTPTSFSVHHGF